MYKIIFCVARLIPIILGAEVSTNTLDKLVLQWSQLEQHHSAIDNSYAH